MFDGCPSLRSEASALRLKAEAGGSSRRPRHFSLLRQSKVPKRKATRSQGHFVVPCGARARWGLAKLASLKQTRALIHLSLRCSALPHGASGIGCGRACEGALLPLRSGGFALCLKAEAGVAARRPPHFLCFAKESKQRKATRSQGHFVVPCAAQLGKRDRVRASLRTHRRNQSRLGVLCRWWLVLAGLRSEASA